MNRRTFVKTAMGTSLVLLSPLSAACNPLDLHLQKVLDHIQRLKTAKHVDIQGEQTFHQIIAHCTQSVDCALDGYPEMKPAWMRKSVGKAAFHAFSLVSHMKHDLAAPIPGLAPMREGDVPLALARLEAAFQRLKEARGVHPHFFFGALSPTEMERAQVMHFWNHMEAIKIS